MKLTQSKNAGYCEFYRDNKKGYLISRTLGTDKTREVVEDVLSKTSSFLNRMLVKPQQSEAINKKLNPFYDLLSCLVKEPFQLVNIASLDKIIETYNRDQDLFLKQIRSKISYYGRNLKASAESKSLEMILLTYYQNNDKTALQQELQALSKNLIGRIQRKKHKLTLSIENNIIPYDNEDIIGTRPKILFGLLTPSSVDWSSFDAFWQKYDFAVLLARFKICKPRVEESKHLYKALYNVVIQHNKECYNRLNDNANIEINSLYLNEVQRYFRRLFIDNKHTKNSMSYESETYVKSQIKRYLTNQIVSALILYGKILHYKENSPIKYEKISSNLLSYIQIEEAFKKQMILSISWAVTRLNYLFDYASQNQSSLFNEGTKDILLNGHYRERFYEQLKTDKEASKYLISKLYTCFNFPDHNTSYFNTDVLKAFLEETVTAIYTLRNGIFHFKIDFKLDASTQTKTHIPFDIENSYALISDLLSNDISSINERFKEQIRSTGIATYFSYELLEGVFSKEDLKIELYAPQNAMTPSFKKLYKRGCNLSQSNRNDKRIEWLVQLNDEVDPQARLSYKNLLQLIYYHSFLPYITTSEGERYLLSYIKKTKEWSKKEAERKLGKKTYRYRYEAMPDLADGTSLLSYTQLLQRQQLLRENETNIIEKKGNYYVDFVQDLFLLAYDDYLKSHIGANKSTFVQSMEGNNGLDIQNAEKSVDKLFDSDKLILSMNTALSEDTKLKGMYLYLRLLDERELNLLLHQFIRYRTSLQEREILAPDTLKILIEVEELISLVQFTIPTPIANSDRVKGLVEYYSAELDKHFNSFFEGANPKAFGEMYVQSDKKTPVFHRSLYRVARSGAMALYKNILSGEYKITQKDYRSYQEKTNESVLQEQSHPTRIQEQQKRICELHKELCKCKKVDDARSQYYVYSDLVDEVKEYEKLRHKLTFETLYRVHQLHIELLGRFASFSVDWERDMLFMLTALKALRHADIEVDSIFRSGSVVGKLCKIIDNNESLKSLFEELCWGDAHFDNDIWDRLNIRNKCAHLNHITQNPKRGEPQPSIIEMINAVRTLMSYDIKRQNAVTQTIKDILEKQYKLNLSLVPLKYQSNMQSDYKPVEFKLNCLKTAQVSYLKNLSDREQKNVDANSETYVKCVKLLLEFRYETNQCE